MTFEEWELLTLEQAAEDLITAQKLGLIAAARQLEEQNAKIRKRGERDISSGKCETA